MRLPSLAGWVEVGLSFHFPFFFLSFSIFVAAVVGSHLQLSLGAALVRCAVVRSPIAKHKAVSSCAAEVLVLRNRSSCFSAAQRCSGKDMPPVRRRSATMRTMGRTGGKKRKRTPPVHGEFAGVAADSP